MREGGTDRGRERQTEREAEREGGAEREGERENPKQVMCYERRAQRGLNPTTIRS